MWPAVREGQPGGEGHPCHHSVSQGDSDVRTPGVLVITLIPGAQVVSIPERPWECAFERKSPSSSQVPAVRTRALGVFRRGTRSREACRPLPPRRKGPRGSVRGRGKKGAPW